MNTLYTPRLILKNWHQGDLPAFINLHLHPQVNYWLGGLMTAERAQAYFEDVVLRQNSQSWGLWAVWLPENIVIGAAGLEKTHPDLPFTGVEATWRLLPDYWGKGYATEAMQCIIQQAFRHYGFEEIVTFTAEQNHRSQAVMRRLGFMPDPTRDFDHPRLPREHPLRPHVVYWLSKNNFFSFHKL